MPLEETANVMHMLAAIALREGGNVSWLAEFFAEPAALPRWRDFIYASLPVVPTQGTTDDFLGVVHNSTNLGIKGAVGLAAYGILASMAGNASDANAAWEYAGYSAAVNLRNGFFVDTVAAGGVNRSHFCWGWNFCAGATQAAPPNSTFLMYNFLYSRVLRMHNLFPSQAEVIAQQMAYYELALEGTFGLPLMNGSTGAMPEWQSFFAASLIPPNGSAPPSALRVFDTFLSGLLVIGGVLIASRISAVAAVVGAFIGTYTAVMFGVDPSEIYIGLWGYDATLAAICVAGMFVQLSLRSSIIAAMAALFAVMLHGAMRALLLPVGLPPLTFAAATACSMFTALAARTDGLYQIPLLQVTVPEEHMDDKPEESTA